MFLPYIYTILIFRPFAPLGLYLFVLFSLGRCVSEACHCPTWVTTFNALHLVMLCSFHPWDNITTSPDFNMFYFRDTPGFRHVAHLMISMSFLQCQLKLSIVVVKIIVISVYVFDQFLFPDPNFLGFQGKRYYFSALLCSDLF
jgi:hypothetical protein